MNGNVQVLGCVRLHKPTKAAKCNFYMNQMGFPEGLACAFSTSKHLHFFKLRQRARWGIPSPTFYLGNKQNPRHMGCNQSSVVAQKLCFFCPCLPFAGDC